MRAVLSLGSVLLFTIPGVVYCECLANPPPKEALWASEAVFVGRVIKVEEGKTENRFEFEVHFAWKGVNAPRIFVSSDAMVGCGGGTTFWQGHLYLIYAKVHNGSLWTESCSRTSALEWAGQDLAELGRPQTVFNVEPAPVAMDGVDVDPIAAPSGLPGLLVMTFAIGVSLGWVFARWYRNRRPIFAEANHE